MVSSRVATRMSHLSGLWWSGVTFIEVAGGPRGVMVSSVRGRYTVSEIMARFSSGESPVTSVSGPGLAGSVPPSRDHGAKCGNTK